MADEMGDEPPDLLEVNDAGSQAGPSRIAPRRKIPITLLTGYLGAGKSTLLEYILTAEHGYKIAVCMNDFGDTADIEAKSLTLKDPVSGAETTSYLSLPNGCLCCSFKDMGIAAIEELAHSQDVDWVMVELTGVADPLGEVESAEAPAQIAKDFWANEEMGDLVLDGVICVVDCRNVLRQLDEPPGEGGVNECQRQVACADVILLNKTDLVSSGTLSEVERVIQAINPTLRSHQTVRSQIPLSDVFNLKAYTTQPLRADQYNSPGLNHSLDHEHDHNHNHDDPRIKPSIHSNISTVLIPLPALSSAQWEILTDFLEVVIWESRLPSSPKTPKVLDILRTKGIIYTETGEQYVLQGVTDLFELKPLPAVSAASAESRDAGKVVFIGRHLEGIKEALYEAVGIKPP